MMSELMGVTAQPTVEPKTLWPCESTRPRQLLGSPEARLSARIVPARCAVAVLAAMPPPATNVMSPVPATVFRTTVLLLTDPSEAMNARPTPSDEATDVVPPSAGAKARTWFPATVEFVTELGADAGREAPPPPAAALAPSPWAVAKT